MGRLIDADALIAEYDRVHIGKPGGARKLIVDAPTIEERKWIPCSERLPETDRNVLACEKYDVFVGYYIDEMIGWHDLHSNKRYPTAWQEMPEPYTEGNT